MISGVFRPRCKYPLQLEVQTAEINEGGWSKGGKEGRDKEGEKNMRKWRRDETHRGLEKQHSSYWFKWIFWRKTQLFSTALDLSTSFSNFCETRPALFHFALYSCSSGQLISLFLTSQLSLPSFPLFFSPRFRGYTKFPDSISWRQETWTAVWKIDTWNIDSVELVVGAGWAQTQTLESKGNLWTQKTARSLLHRYVTSALCHSA